MKSIAVLLTVFNRKEKTISCLKHLFAQILIEGITIDVYLTDDGCTDGTPDAIAELFPNVHIIKGDGNLFWNRGMWNAWQAASKNKDYDWYLWLNDDTFLFEDTIINLVRTSLNSSQPNIIVGATKSTNGEDITYGGRHNSIGIPPCNGNPHLIHTFNGNIVLVSKEAFKMNGNLDYYFTHSKGDIDYGLRALKNNITMLQYGEPLGCCDAHPSLDKWCNPNTPILQRLKTLHKPNGMPPKETFHLEKRHYGLVPACLHFCTIYIRCIFPRLWCK